MKTNKKNKATVQRKLIDLDVEVIKKLKIKAIQQDYGSVKEYIQMILTEQAQID